jgi:hypothetical protein
VTEAKKKEITRKKLIGRLIFLVIYGSFLIILYYVLIKFGFNPYILLFIFLFLFLVSVGPFFRQSKRTLYSRMYPDRKRRSSMNQQKIKLAPEENERPQPKIFRPVNLDASYNKPLIIKCEKCRNTIPSFVKRCPFCNRQMKY